jgi:hypothetical protein
MSAAGEICGRVGWLNRRAIDGFAVERLRAAWRCHLPPLRPPVLVGHDGPRVGAVTRLAAFPAEVWMVATIADDATLEAVIAGLRGLSVSWVAHDWDVRDLGIASIRTMRRARVAHVALAPPGLAMEMGCYVFAARRRSEAWRALPNPASVIA